ncbi:Upf3 regulator of nonsense transcripts-like prote in [Trichuris trichiura]|uniref:Upf3 regulator of nonsense transcripts-like prote in n=1 Tax=Trichuris trichiura TaxID=36087 RepID=A0A077YY56_TRITR|nr:Upf3 regulator of nonsense transcripts-like prote in [Trichuris trichiura]
MGSAQNNGIHENCFRKTNKTFAQLEHCSLRVVIRRLPANLTEEEFVQMVSPLPPHRDFKFVPADGEVYLTFNDIEDMIAFRDIFNGHVFVDSKGKLTLFPVMLALCQIVLQTRFAYARLARIFISVRTLKNHGTTWRNHRWQPTTTIYCWKRRFVFKNLRFDLTVALSQRAKEAKRKQKEEERKKKETERQKRLEKIKKEREAAKKAAAESRNV